MGFEFILSGYDENRKERTFKIIIDETKILFYVDNNKISIKDSRDKIIENLSMYTNEKEAPKQYYDRLFFHYFFQYKNDKCIENLIRAFAVSSTYLYWFPREKFSEININFKIETMKKHFYDRLLIDWDGSMNPQPQMYFIQKEIIENNTNGVISLYKTRLIQRYSLVSPYKINFYYVPFDISSIRNFAIIGQYALWLRILNGINKEVVRLTQNRSV